jgi:glycosyltransferase involved in cell wall biosynthesis
MASSVLDIVNRPSAASVRENTRVAWLFPSLARAYYWQPVFKEFVARCPNTAIFTSIWPGFAPGYENAFEVHTLPGLGFVEFKKAVDDSRRGFIWTPLSIVKKLAAFHPDVVFACGFSGWTVCALLFKLFRRSRVIIYWEGCSAQSVSASRIKLQSRRWIGRFADAAVSNAEEGTSYLRDVIGMPEGRLLCHPCQVPDLSLLCSAAVEGALTETKRHPVFLYVGSISPRKGWRYLIEAIRMLVDQGHLDFSVLFVGSGEQDEVMRTAITEYSLDGIVEQIGFVPYHNLGPYFESVDVFISPSRADTWGVAVLEAMAFGKPVLCSKFVGARQMISHGENGFIFDPFDPEQLAGYMAKFIQDQSLAERLGRRSREKIRPYTAARAADALVDLVVEQSQLTVKPLLHRPSN